MPYTLLTFHAHPDDEAIATGGVMAQAAAEGHRVVLVLATRGELGEVSPGVLDEGEALWQRRVAETHAAAEVLGVARVEFLGYRDSGMMGEPSNHEPGSFWSADVDEAASRLAAILEEERPDVLTVYDSNGGYGHPDHIQVHRVGVRAAAVARVPLVYEAVMNRDHIRRFLETAPPEWRPPLDPETLDGFGVPEEVITTSVDVTAYVGLKRAAMRAHATQIPETSFFLTLPEDVFALVFGTEWFVRRDAPPGTVERSLFEGLQ